MKERRADRLLIGFAFNLKPTDEVPPSQEPESSANPHIDFIPSEANPTGAADNFAAFDDTYAEWDDESTIAAIEGALSQAGAVIRLEADAEFPLKLRDARPDIVFNFAEGIGGPSRESHVPAFCEFWGIPYTGSDPLTLGVCLDKARTKETLTHHGIPTPEFQVVERPEQLSHSVELPAVVKPLHEGSSKGISQRSFCTTWADVESEVARVVERYNEPAIIERFLGGREFTAAVIGNDGDGRVLPIVELDFETLPADAHPIYGFEAKWIWDRPEKPLDIFHCPARCSPKLRHRVEEIAMAAYRTLRCRDWARIDIRCDGDERPHILEVNPLPGVIPDPAANSCYPKAARAAGLSFDELILTVLRAAAARYDLRVPD
ncbi:MAG: ATP-grasp domain-containing protein [Gemmatimonadota bacterium]|nr:MAG: ATP-grasp domain-containing protein [Gemmatimonadota bacterium]